MFMRLRLSVNAGILLALGGLAAIVPLPARADEDDEPGHHANPFEIGVYAEILYAHYNYGRMSGEPGSTPADRSIMDLQRFVLELEYAYSKHLYFESEIEFEHGGTGSAVEPEEFENEIEKGGDIEIEELHLTWVVSSGLNLRAGHVIVPVGAINAAHLPTDYFTTVRPESEISLIPVTWHETGLQAFGDLGGFRYQALLVNGLDSSGFDSRSWIRGGRQARFEQVKATGMAGAVRLDYTGLDGVVAGVSGYVGNSTSNRPEPDMEGIDGRVSIVDGHARADLGPVAARGEVLYGAIENADLISRNNSRLPAELGVPRTPVAKNAFGWSVEAGVNVARFLFPDSRLRLVPFGRYETYDSMYRTDPGILADPRFDRSVVTLGLDLFVTDQVVIKTDYAMRSLGKDPSNDENTFGLALGFHTK